MMKCNKKILVLVLASFMVTATPVHATMKLEATGPVADILNKIQKIKEKYEDIQSKILKEKEKWTKKAEAFMEKTLGTEGAALFKQYVVKPGAGIVKSVAKGQFNAGDFRLRGFTDAIKSEIGNYKLDFATLVAQSRDMAETYEKARYQKRQKMEAQVVELRAEWEAKNILISQISKDDIKYEELAKDIENLAERISKLEQQKSELSNGIAESNEFYKSMQGNIKKLQKMIADSNNKISQDEMLKKLNQEALNLFTLKMEDEETDALYAAKIEKLFLGRFETGMSVNLDRVRKARKEEYYKSEKNLVNVIINTYKSISETQDKMKKCDQARDEAQAIFGEEGMRVCADIQVAKVGAQYMEMLLAEVRHAAIKEINSWTDKYRVPDYGRDYSKFNLDDYSLTKKDLKKNLGGKISGAVTNTMMNFKGF